MGITINGSNGPDELFATGGGDTLNGFGGNDVLFGQNGDDVVNGGDGDDYINVRGKGSDTVDGGNGLDRVSYYSTAGQLKVDLEAGTADDGSGAIDHLTNIERISGSSGFADIITGRADTNETLYGNAGDDTLDGGAGGSDTTGYSFITSGGGMLVNLATGTSSGPDGNDVLINFENIEGSGFNDTLIGDNGANVLWGLDGDDQLTGAGGNDTLIGGAGNDRAIYSGNRSDYTITTLANGDVTVQDNRGGSPDGTDTVRGVKYLQFADTTLEAKPLEHVVSSTLTGHQAFNFSVMLSGTGGQAANGYATVFRGGDGSGDGVYLRLFNGDGEPRTDDILVATSTTGEQRAPTVVALDDGTIVVMWDSTPEAGTIVTPGLLDIKMQHFDADGNRMGGEVTVNTTTAFQQRFPSVVSTADHGFMAVWQSGQEGSGGNGVYGQKFDNSGAKIGAELHINTSEAGQQLFPIVRQTGTDSNADGIPDQLVAVWMDLQGSGSNASYSFVQQILNADGSKSGGESVVYKAPAGAGLSFMHQTQVEGGYVISWTMTLANGSGAVMARIFNDNGTPRGAAFTAAVGEKYLGTDAISVYNGDIMMVWDVQHADGSSEIVGRNFNSVTGAASGGQYLISDHSNGGNLMYPTLSGSGNGDVVVSWNTQGNQINGDSGGVYQQLVNGNGLVEFGSFNTGEAPAATSFTVQTVAGGAVPQTDSMGHYVLNTALNSGDTTELSHLALSGTATFGTQVTIYSGADALITVGVDDQGLWAADIKNLTAGLHQLTAVVTDVHGNASAASAAFALTVDNAVINGTNGDEAASYWTDHGADANAQVLNGGDGNDTLNGAGGQDTLSGGAGNDTYIYKDGAVIVEAADGGIDTILSDYGVALPDNVENMTNTTSANNGMFGNALDNVLKGGSGNNFMSGGDGNDTLWGNVSNDNFTGDAGNDVEMGGAGDDFFIGGALDSGDDLMDGGAGSDYLNLSTGHDTILGGDGDWDRLDTAINGATHGVNINLATGVIVDNGFGESGVVGGFEEIHGTAFADTLVGSGADEEDFFGNGGNDSVDGGAGFDAFIYGGKANFTGSLATGTGSSSDGTVTFINVEALGGGSGNDSLTGSSKADVMGGYLGNDTLTGGGGNDTLYGGGGNDTAVYRGNKSDYKISTNGDGNVVVQDLRTSGATLDGTDTLVGIRNLQFANGSVKLTAADHVVNSTTSGYQIFQSTAAHWYRDGGFIQVFRGSDGSGDGLYARVFDEDGNPNGNDILINAGATGGDQRAPVVAALQFGGYAVAYHSNDKVGAGYGDPGWDIKVQVLDNGGNMVGGPVSVSTTPGVVQRLPSVAGLDFGGFAVTWQSAQAGEDGHLAIYARMFAANGMPYGPETLVGTVSAYDQTTPTIVSQANNTAVIIWSGVTADGHYGYIEQRIDGNGNKMGDAQTVFTTSDAAATLSAAHSARTADGGHVLSWIYDADGPTTKVGGAGEDVVMARQYDASGNAVGDAFVVSTAGAQTSASVLGLSDGSYMVVWDVLNSDDTSAIMGRRYGADNSPLGAEFKISNTPTAGAKMFPTLAEFQTGQVVVAWGAQGDPQLTANGGIYQQIIDFNGNPLFYVGDNTTTAPATPGFKVQTVVGGSIGLLDPAYPSGFYYLKDAPLASGATTANSHLVISGTAALGSTITIKDGGNVIGTVSADDDGRWALDVLNLLNGAHTLTASVTDLFGKVSAGSTVFNLTVNNAITGTTGADNEAYWLAREAVDKAETLIGGDGNDTLNGNGGADTLNGGSGDDTFIVNNAGVTIVEAAGGGVDTVRTSVALTLAANVENGVVASAGGVALTGNALNNVLTGGDGNDTLNGGAGNDTLQGGKGDDTYVADAAGDVIVEGADGGIDTVQVAFAAPGTYALADNVEHALITGTGAINLTGNALANSLNGNAAGNILNGGGGNDTLDGGAGNDTLVGGDGDDTYVVDSVGDVITELDGGGKDTVVTGLGSYTLIANVENLKYTGSAAFTGTGNAAANKIEGSSGNDTLSGGAGNDTLKGGAGNDSLLGGDGDDVLAPSGGVSGVDVVDGGNGDDTVVLLGNFNAFTRTRVSDTDTKLVNTISGETVTIRNVEHVQFGDGTHDLAELIANSASAGADTIDGTDNADTLDGGAGVDVLKGHGGDDTYLIDNAGDQIVELPGEGKDTALVNLGAAGTYTLGAEVENGIVTSAATVAVNLVGNDSANQLTGNGANNTLTGNGGNDTLIGGAGNDTMIGGTGDDVYSVDSATDVVTELAGGGIDTVETSLSAYTLAANVERLIFTGGAAAFKGTGNELNNTIFGADGNDTLDGGAGNDQLGGGGGNDSLLGGAGNDFVSGGNGNDMLDGGAGNDTLTGGAGNDTIDGGAITDKIGYSDANVVTYDGATPAAVNVNLQTGIAQDGYGGTDKLININFAVGTVYNDVLTGSTNMLLEQFDGGAGDDTIDGGLVTDTLNQENNNRVTYQRSGNAVTVDLEAGTSDGGAGGGNDTLININQVRGSSFDDQLYGSDSALTEQFEGGAGDDTIDGRGGIDLVRYDNATGGVSVNLAAGTASDGYGGTDTLINIEGVRGSSHDDELIGGNPDNGVDVHDGRVEIFMGNGGNDTIDGGQGYDRVDYTTSTAGVLVDLGAGTAQDGLGGTDELHNIEGVRGSAFNDTLLGSDGAEFESFEGREGNDSIDGRGGIDRVDYEHAKAAVTVNLATGAATADGYGGSDTLVNIEDVRGSTFNDSITGNAGDNYLQGLAGNDTLVGGAGADQLAGGEGNDSLLGGDGDDQLLAGTGVDVVDGGAGAGDTLVLLGDHASYTISRPNATDLVLVNTSTGENITARNVEKFAFADGDMSYTDVIVNTVSNFADVLTGTPGKDVINGQGGADTMIGLDGDDTYVIDVAGDVVVEQPNEGHDTVKVAFTAAGTYILGDNVENAEVTSAAAVAVNLTGNALDNSLTGNGAANKLIGGDGNDTLNGGAGNDTMVGGQGNDVYVVDASGDVVTEDAGLDNGFDMVQTSLNSYTLGANVEQLSFTGTGAFNGKGNALGNWIEGGSGNDTLSGDAGFDNLLGGAGNDSLSGGADGDFIVGGAGNDTIDGGAITDRVNFWDGNYAAYYTATTGVTVNLTTGVALDGQGGTDKLININSVYGSQFNDTLIGSTAPVVELFVGGKGDNTIDGGAISNPELNSNMVYYSGSSTGVHVDLATGVAGHDDGSHDTLININQVSGSQYDDTLLGSDSDVIESFDGYQGSNVIDGRGGFDFVRYDMSYDGGVTVNLADGTGQTLTGTDTLSNIEGVVGSWLDDHLTGGNAANGVTLDDGLMEVFMGSGGNDTIDGGQGFDRADYTISNAAVVVNLGTGTAQDGLGGTDQLLNIEGVRGSAFNDTLTGSDGAYETFEGRQGNDSIDGKGGRDLVSYESSLGATKIDLSTGTASDGYGGTDKLLNIEDARGSQFGDSISGSAIANHLEGLGGNDTLLGGAGDDVLDAGKGVDLVDGGADSDTLLLMGNYAAYTITRPTATDLVLVNAATGENITARNVEFFAFADGVLSYAKTIENKVSGFGDVLTGTSGSDTLNGLGGSDTMSGLDGDDTYVIDATGDVIIDSSGHDTVEVAFTAAGTYTLASGLEDAKVTAAATLAVNLVGNSDNNKLTGNAAANTLTAGDGNDTLDGGAGNDIMIGGSGNDTYYVDATGDVVTEAADAGSDRVYASLASYTLTANVERLYYNGSGNFNATGNALDNDIYGGDGNDTINGGAGSDALYGGKGNDSVLGGDGDDALYVGTGANDVADGGAGNDMLILDGNFGDFVRTRLTATDTRLVNSISGESVTIRNIETVLFNGVSKTLEQVNFNLPSVGNDNLEGSGGADTMDGGAGSDTMAGLGGDDTYVVDVATDVVVEADGGGKDQVQVAFKAAGTYAMTDFVEDATITGTLAVNVVGNDQNNVLTGNSAANMLSGGGGDDKLIGGAGNDTLIGGAGNDVYVVDVAGDVVTEGASAGTDRVETGLASYTLAANVENLTYTGAAAFAGIGNVLDNIIIGGVGKDTLTGGLGNDSLTGGAGDDSLLGGDGNDTLVAGTGAADVADGGLGDDLVQVLGNFSAYTRTRVTATDTKLVNATSGESLTIRNVETVHFADGDKTMDAVNFNLVSVGNDTLVGGAGADTLNGGTGADLMSGGDGDDTYVVDVAGDVVTELDGEGTDLVNVAFAAAGTYVMTANVENATVTGTVAINVTGNELANVLIGNAVNNTLAGGGGNDSLDGGAGNDSLLGGDGNDTLNGGAGSDTLTGGGGNDVYAVDVATDVVTELDGGGVDRVETALASYTLGNFVDNLTYTGTAAFAGTGNALANEIIGGIGKDTLTGGAGNDTLRGGAGDDSLLGGDGDDSLVAGTGTADIVDGGAGSDTVEVLGNFAAYTRTRVTATDTRLVNAATGETLTIRNVELVKFADGTKSLDAVNDNLASAGNDVLTGTDGADTINGGAGADTMSGGLGNDTYMVDNNGDVVTELDGEGVDLAMVAFTVAGTYTLTANVENATAAGSIAINLAGNDLDNVLVGNGAANILTGNAGNDSLDGGAGNDTLLGGDGNDTLNGGAGTDSMTGGAGDDVYVVDAAESVVEGVGGGTDRVETALTTYTLGANVENLRYTATSATAFTGTGNALDNEIRGGNGNDRLLGGAGNDTLIGGAGNDTLTGGTGAAGDTGADTFVLSAATGVDTITDFGSGIDKISISQLALAIGNGDTVVDGGVLRGAAGGFDAGAELVIFTANAGGATTATAATAIGSANSGFTLGQQALFVVDNGSSSYVYLFKSSGTDATVSAAELTQIAVLTGTPATTLADYQFVA